MSNTVKVKVSTLIFDYDLYPRMNTDSQAINNLIDAMDSGCQLPPVIVDRKTKRIVDGFHRCKAALRRDGEHAEVDVEFRSYKNDKELFLECARLNNNHGVKLDKYDRVHCGLRARDLGISDKIMAKALNVPFKRFQDLLEKRTAKIKRLSGSNGENDGAGESGVIPIKNTIKHKAGQQLTRDQAEAVPKIGGMNQMFYVNQIIILLENDLVDGKNEKLLDRMADLYELLHKYLLKAGAIA